jgi:hypothetical protein
MTSFREEEYFTLQVIGFSFHLLTVAGRMIYAFFLKDLVLFGMCTCQRIFTPSKFYIFSFFLWPTIWLSFSIVIVTIENFSFEKLSLLLLMHKLSNFPSLTYYMRITTCILQRELASSFQLRCDFANM